MEEMWTEENAQLRAALEVCDRSTEFNCCLIVSVVKLQHCLNLP